MPTSLFPSESISLSTRISRSDQATDDVSSKKNDDDLREYHLDRYDDDDDDSAKDVHDPGVSMGMFGNIKSLAYHDTNEDDPYITLHQVSLEIRTMDIMLF